MALAALALASSLFAVLYPEEFAAACGQGLLDPGSLIVALGQP